MTELERFVTEGCSAAGGCKADSTCTWNGCTAVPGIIYAALSIIEKMDTVFIAVQNAESEPALRAAQEMCRDADKDIERMLANRRYDDSERSDS